MRIAAVIAALISAGFLGFALWLYRAADGVYSSEDYARDHVVVIGQMEADGSGIFIPAVLAAAVGVFFAVYARKLWRRP